MVLTDGPQTKAYSWSQNTKKFDVKAGDEITVHITTQQWAWDIVVAFDWDIDGVFDAVYRAFDNPDTEEIEKAENFFKETPGWGSAGNTFKEWTFIVPEDATPGFTRMRVLVDGDGYAAGGTPPFNLCGSIGYAGSMHDYGITIAAATNIESLNNAQKAKAYFNGSQLVVENVEAGSLVSVYNLSGALLNQSLATESVFKCDINGSKGVYIVKVLNNSAFSTVKVIKFN